jgi:hypothetical protein
LEPNIEGWEQIDFFLWSLTIELKVKARNFAHGQEKKLMVPLIESWRPTKKKKSFEFFFFGL